MKVVLHPQQVREALELAAELDLDPADVVAEMWGPDVVVALPAAREKDRPTLGRRVLR